jgi:beta-phosphoglucomutase-like phosphatase (HAD superfamily)
MQCWTCWTIRAASAPTRDRSGCASTLEKTRLWDRFRPYVYSARDVGEGRGKPAPDVFLHAAGALGSDPADAVVIEDSVAGVTGAVAAGMRVIGFTGASHSWPGHGEA